MDGVSERDAALVALAAGREREAHRARVEALTGRSGAAAPALRKVLGEVRTALFAVVTVTAVT
ncbi:hypothetical protein [Streptomyces poonensis]|uniref:Uncharacterized protein n=1 Tax=Streptomyces poonensis TaxID=68255 RepID=A0A918UW28_9ACTN|nr:hypothetical protein [Streptomyces poonensis]GGZ38540.1 hypothetical protein GCM10010365_69120 [Streptomyces poonensis]